MTNRMRLALLWESLKSTGLLIPAASDKILPLKLEYRRLKQSSEPTTEETESFCKRAAKVKEELPRALRSPIVIVDYCAKAHSIRFVMISQSSAFTCRQRLIASTPCTAAKLPKKLRQIRKRKKFRKREPWPEGTVIMCRKLGALSCGEERRRTTELLLLSKSSYERSRWPCCACKC